jgi:hypothetical protein
VPKCIALAIVISVAACGKKSDTGGNDESEKKLEGPIRIAFGACAYAPRTFVSGPRPEPAKLTAGPTDHRNYGASTSGTIGRTTKKPTVAIGQPNSQGDLDKAVIRRLIKLNIAKITYCYEKQLLSKPSLSGTVSTQFFIAPNGKVTSSAASGVDAEVANCVAEVIKQIEFPKPKGGGGVQVNYPFTFRVAMDDPPPPPPEDKPDDGRDESGGTGTAMALDEGKMGKKDSDRAEGQYKMKKEREDPDILRGRDDDDARNPLARVRAEIVDCLHGQTKRYGVVAVELGSKISAYGADDRTNACIATAAGNASALPDMRCPLAFGTMPASDLPAIDLAPDTIAWNGKVVAQVNAIAGDTQAQIAPLYEPLRAYAAETKAATTLIALRGPVLIRPADATPMKLVMRALATAFAADVPATIGSRPGDTGAWKLVRDIELPVAPVAIGEGAPWHGRRKAETQLESEMVILSILVAKDRLWVMLSRVAEVIEVPDAKSGHDWAKLASELAEHKRSAFFAGRADEIEIAGEDDARYGDVVRAIETAAKAGFARWELLEPRGLSTQPKP